MNVVGYACIYAGDEKNAVGVTHNADKYIRPKSYDNCDLSSKYVENSVNNNQQHNYNRRN